MLANDLNESAVVRGSEATGSEATASEAGIAVLRLPVLLVPAYKPDPGLPASIHCLQASGELRATVVVDDGSGPEFKEVFTEISRIPGVYLLRHVVNLGKGAALKAALNFIACTFPESVGAVTADADGQHAKPDVLATAAALKAAPESLILGCRQFNENVPFRSKFGNTMTRGVMRVLMGQDISDTQTGLRGIPMAFIPELLHSKATKYDFELDMLLICRESGRRIAEVPIRTIYIDGNKSSHFNPLIDSMRVYFVFIRFASVSLITAGLDNLVFFAAFSFWPYIFLCQLLSRTCSGIFNYQVNKQGVFHSRTPASIAAPRYALTSIVAGVVSYLAITGLVQVIKVNVFVAKLSVETSLFVFSFVIQRTFVFRAGVESE